MKAALRPGFERHIPWSLWLTLGLFLMTYCWPFAPLTCKAFQAVQVTDADDAVAPTAPARVTQAAAAVITLSSFLADRPTGLYMMSTSFLRVRATTVTALIPVTLILPENILRAALPRQTC